MTTVPTALLVLPRFYLVGFATFARTLAADAGLRATLPAWPAGILAVTCILQS